MWLPESVYNTVPGVYIAFGLSTLYFGSEAWVFGRSMLYTALLFMSGITLIISGILVMKYRRRKSEPRRALAEHPDPTH